MSHQHDESDINDLGLQADLSMWQRRPLERRRVLQLGVVGIGALLASCSGAAKGSSSGASSSVCVTEIPEETAGPFPATGSSYGLEGKNLLTRSGIVRKDIKTSLETGNTAAGIPTTLTLQLVNSAGACAPLAGYAIYAWHCDRDGGYSLYSTDVLEEDYLRGVQETDEDGMVTFETIFPACYAGRWPHVHFEIYPSLETATSADNKLHTSQLAIPQAVCEAVYTNTEGYSQSVTNLSQISLETDNVFSDGYASQLAAVTGSMNKGYTMTLQVGVDV